MKVTNINVDELIINKLYSDEEINEEIEEQVILSRSRRYGYGQEFCSRTCKWESGSGTLRKLKITNCNISLICQLLFQFASPQELEIEESDGFNTPDIYLESSLSKMTRLEKLTIPFLDHSVHHIPYVNTREVSCSYFFFFKKILLSVRYLRKIWSISAL
jgi:hypothetical protein